MGLGTTYSERVGAVTRTAGEPVVSLTFTNLDDRPFQPKVSDEVAYMTDGELFGRISRDLNDPSGEPVVDYSEKLSDGRFKEFEKRGVSVVTGPNGFSLLQKSSEGQYFLREAILSTTEGLPAIRLRNNGAKVGLTFVTDGYAWDRAIDLIK